MPIEITSKLLARYLAGDTTPEQDAAIRSWRAASPEHQARFDALEEAWNAGGVLGRSRVSPDSWDIGAGWEAVVSRLEARERETSHRATPADRVLKIGAERSANRRSDRRGHAWRGSRWLAAAASIVLLLGAGAGLIGLLRVLGSSESYRTFVAERGQRGEIRLTDGSIVLLAPGSSIEVPVPFGDEERVVKLAGEAYFDVVSLPARPFIVRADGSITEVVGTEFSVRAFPAEDEIRVVVAEGKVRLSAGDTSSEPALAVEAGKMGALNRNDGKLRLAPVDLGEALGWLHGRLVFKATPLGSVVKELSRWSGITFRTASADLNELHFTGDFSRESVREMVDVITYTLNLSYERSGDTITFRPTPAAPQESAGQSPARE